MASSLITDFLGAGVVASRPADPGVPTGATALYYATDELTLYAWDGSNWQAVSATGDAPEIVQSKLAALSNMSTGVTLDSTPTPGNMLIAFLVNASTTIPSEASGWTSLFFDTTVPDCRVVYKIAGGSEPAAQAPTGTTNGGVVAVFEIANARTPSVYAMTDEDSSVSSFSITQAALPQPLTNGVGLMLATTTRQAATLPSSISGDGSAGPTVSDGGVGVAMATFSHAVAPGGSFSTTVTYGGSAATRRLWMVIA